MTFIKENKTNMIPNISPNINITNSNNNLLIHEQILDDNEEYIFKYGIGDKSCLLYNYKKNIFKYTRQKFGINYKSSGITHEYNIVRFQTSANIILYYVENNENINDCLKIEFEKTYKYDDEQFYMPTGIGYQNVTSNKMLYKYIEYKIYNPSNEIIKKGKISDLTIKLLKKIDEKNSEELEKIYELNELYHFLLT